MLLLKSAIGIGVGIGILYSIRNKNVNNYLAERVKNPSVDIQKWSNSFFGLGLCVALSMALLAFSYTSYKPISNGSFELDVFSEDIEIDIPNTAHSKPLPPPPPPVPLLIEIPEVEVDEQIDFVDQSIEAPDVPVVEKPIAVKKPVEAPKFQPPEQEEYVDEIITFAEEMPSFPGCTAIEDSAERKACETKKLFSFIGEHLSYPRLAKENDIEGTVVVRFVVDEKGVIGQAKIIRDIGGGCGDEVLRLMDKMPTWNPGRQGARNVSVWFTMPVKFKLM